MALGLAKAVLAAALAGGALAHPAPVVVERRVASMGTSLDIAIVAENREAGLDASELVVHEARRVEDLLTTWHPSPLTRLNSAPVGEEITVGREIATVL